MKLRMLVDTVWDGTVLPKGSLVDLPGDQALVLFNFGRAEAIEEAPGPGPEVETAPEDEPMPKKRRSRTG